MILLFAFAPLLLTITGPLSGDEYAQANDGASCGETQCDCNISPLIAATRLFDRRKLICKSILLEPAQPFAIISLLQFADVIESTPGHPESRGSQGHCSDGDHQDAGQRLSDKVARSQIAWADWVGWATIAAGVGSLFAAVGAGCAALFAKRAVQAARNQLDLQRKANKAQLQAYFGVEGITIETTPYSDYAANIVIVATLRNFGATPAMNVMTSIYADVYADRSAFFNDERMHQQTNGGLIMPSGVMKLRQHISLPAAIYNDVKAGRMEIIVAVWFAYETAFGESRGELSPWSTTGNLFDEGLFEHILDGGVTG